MEEQREMEFETEVGTAIGSNSEVVKWKQPLVLGRFLGP